MEYRLRLLLLELGEWTYSGGVKALESAVVGEVVADGVLARESCGEGILSWSSGNA